MVEKKVVAHIIICDLSIKERLWLLKGVFIGKVGLNIYDKTMKGLGFIKKKRSTW